MYKYWILIVFLEKEVYEALKYEGEEEIYEELEDNFVELAC